jgi:hypothetical protein
VLERALQNEVEARFPSAAEFMQALNRATGPGPRTRPADWAENASKWFKL